MHEDWNNSYNNEKENLHKTMSNKILNLLVPKVNAINIDSLVLNLQKDIIHDKKLFRNWNFWELINLGSQTEIWNYHSS